MIDRIIKGVNKFSRDIYPQRATEFQELAGGQSPLALFITCSDSRVNPNLLTQTKPGELFVIRNAGNLVPPFGSPVGGELATIEFAVGVLKVPHIIVCGHSHCGAMQAALNPESANALPLVKEWITLADTAQRLARQDGQSESADDLLWSTVQANVLAQLDHLRTIPAVATAMHQNTVQLHGWVYRIETGEVLAYQRADRRFVPLQEVKPVDQNA